MFSMGGSIQAAGITSNSSNFLKAGIHKVVFKGIEMVENADAAVVKFETPDGSQVHNERLFSPRDNERKDRNGILSASEFENFLAKCKLLIKALDPVLFDKIEKDGSKFAAPDFASFIKLLKKYLDQKIGTETNIKLIPTKGNYVGFPYSVTGISKDGALYINNNFIGENLMLTAYETRRIEEAASARPTDMSRNVANDDLTGISDDFDVKDEDDDDGLPF